MESHDIEPDRIIDWAVSYADYDELEKVAKALYSLYIQRRRTEQPEAQAKARKWRNKYHQKK